MYCQNCHKDFIEKRTVKTLFTIFEYKVCQDCLEKFKFNPDFITIPLDNKYKLEIVSLYKEKVYMNVQAFSEQYEVIKQELVKTHKDYLLREYVDFKLSEEEITKLEELSNKRQSNILVITFFFIDKALS